MDVSLVLKVAGVGLLVSVAQQILSRTGREEQAMLVSVAGIVLVLLLLVEEIGRLFALVESVFGF
ncbi:MAG: stage III sporulation protein AC [Clostridia bacterium]|nr:stage III sporulation protein AC [Clostridia bacterium]